jgi:hypothetical protein
VALVGVTIVGELVSDGETAMGEEEEGTEDAAILLCEDITLECERVDYVKEYKVLNDEERV